MFADATGAPPRTPRRMPRPVLYLAFANDRQDGARYLRNLPAELRGIRAALAGGVATDQWEVVERSNVTADDLLDVFQARAYRDRVAVLHFGGHAGSYALLLETATGHAAAADAGGLAAFLAEQRGLALVFLNGCSTRGQVRGLLAAGVPAVVATTRDVDDATATAFAVRFYRALAVGATVRRAFAEASAGARLGGVAPSSAAAGARPAGGARDLVWDDGAADGTADGTADGAAAADEAWPWELHVSDGAADAEEWHVGLACGDPLFGLPPLPPGDLPPSPFRHLHWFGAEHAPVFFGRGREIRALYERVTSPEAPPVTLLYGQSGVGKSSLLAAGLLPRLAATHATRYLRRDAAGLAGALAVGLDAVAADARPPVALARTAWVDAEARLGRPLVLLVDQAEEAFTRPLPAPVAGVDAGRAAPDGDEFAAFAAALAVLLRDERTRPAGRLVLGFRKEWLAEIERRLGEARVPYRRVFLERLDHAGVVEAITGPARTARLRAHYGLVVEEGLAATIADDLLADAQSAVAPTLQVLLTKLWGAASAADRERPRFDRALYQRLAAEGILLDDFLSQQLAAAAATHPAAAASGLALDLLAHHTTALGTARTRPAAERDAAYAHVAGEAAALVQRLLDLYLLADATAEGVAGAGAGARLAHDTLAPLVRRRHERSDLPGQRARRILESRAADWDDGGRGAPLDEADLATVEAGARGMRAWTALAG